MALGHASSISVTPHPRKEPSGVARRFGEAGWFDPLGYHRPARRIAAISVTLGGILTINIEPARTSKLKAAARYVRGSQYPAVPGRACGPRRFRRKIVDVTLDGIATL